jgi:hypothetical protein
MTRRKHSAYNQIVRAVSAAIDNFQGGDPESNQYRLIFAESAQKGLYGLARRCYVWWAKRNILLMTK